MLTFKESDVLLKKYADEYNKSKVIDLKGVEALKDSSVCDNVATYIDTENKYTYYYSVQSRIDLVLDRLDWECSTFLKKEFFNCNVQKYWWLPYFSKSTYYRLKKKYMQKFLELYYA